jgi:hypothetical protein
MPAQQDDIPLFTSKKCPYCDSYLATDERYCFSCNKRVGPLDKKTGMAKQPINWLAYIICILYWAFLGLYLWWAF